MILLWIFLKSMSIWVVVIFLSQFSNAGTSHAVMHHCHHLFANSWRRQSRPSPFSLVLDNCMLSVPLGAARGKVAKSAKCCPQGTLWYQGRFNLFFVTFVVLSCQRVCLLDVSRLIILTVRPSAPVSCCHQDSWTRWRLAFVQEAVRVSIGFARDDMFPVVSNDLQKQFPCNKAIAGRST